MKLRPKNWEKFQHYKHRTPPWIRLHRSLLDDRKWSCLQIASKALAPMLWLLASESTDGIFDASSDELVFRLRVTHKEIKDGLKQLIVNGFFEVIEADASTMLAPCLHDATSEKSRVETEQRQSSSSAAADAGGFEKFWESYPRKTGKGAARNAWAKAKLPEIDIILSALHKAKKSPDWLKERGSYIPHPATWLNQCRWEDSGMDYEALTQKRVLSLSSTQQEAFLIDEQDALNWIAENYEVKAGVPYRDWPQNIQAEYRNSKRVFINPTIQPNYQAV